MSEKHTFIIREIGELEGHDFDGVILEGDHEAIRDAGRFFGERVSLSASPDPRLAMAREALKLLLKEHDILSGNFGEVMDPRHAKSDRWPTAAERARTALTALEAPDASV